MKYDKNYLNKLRKEGVKPHKYVQNLEGELKETIKSRNDWVEAALNIRENGEPRVVENIYIVPDKALTLISLCALLIIFNLGVLLLWL